MTIVPLVDTDEGSNPTPGFIFDRLKYLEVDRDKILLIFLMP